MLALSTNSPFLRGQPTGMMSSRTPVYRALPRAGIPPHFGSWDAYASRVEVMMRAGAIHDYTYLWWDVRPHPNLGTVEVRVFDQQTRVELTIALAALTVSMAHRLSAFYDDGAELVEYPTELVDDNKVRAAVKGMNGVLLDFWAGEQVPAERFAMRLLGVLSEHAQELGCERELAGVGELLAGNTGAHRQLRIWEQTPDLKALVGGASSRPAASESTRCGSPLCSVEPVDSPPELSVVCKKCGSEVSPYVTECPYCGTRLRKRAPKLERHGDELTAQETQARPPAAEGRDARARGASATAYDVGAAVGDDRRPRDPGRRDDRPARRRASPVSTSGAIVGPVGDEYWRYLAAPFVYDDLGYLFAIGLALAIFLPEVERRLGTVPSALLVLACGALGMLFAVGLEDALGRRAPRRRRRQRHRARRAGCLDRDARRRPPPRPDRRSTTRSPSRCARPCCCSCRSSRTSPRRGRGSPGRSSGSRVAWRRAGPGEGAGR